MWEKKFVKKEILLFPPVFLNTFGSGKKSHLYVNTTNNIVYTMF